ncbi:sulfatase-like hydrolase/transferase, partial [bacterium]|nr:sulfatase-like hydrolase/transferase [bacterium]
YMTDDFTDYALQFLDEHNKKENDPFFLYLAYTAPHWPLHAFPEDIKKYKGKYSKGWDKLRQERYERQKKMGIIDDSVALAPLDGKVVPWEEAEPKVKKEFETEMEIYAAMIDRMDQNIGRVVKKLEQMGELDNTFIVFLSDNGGCHTTPSFPHLQGTPGGPNSFPCYGYMGAELSNVPFRKYKQYIHEGGIATPCIVHYPAMVKRQNRIEDQAGHIIDILPTVAELCGAAYPEKRKGQSTKPLPGMSLKPALQGKPVFRGQPIFWEHVRNKGMRDGDWKLVAAKPDLNWELYNLRTDRAELHDLSQQYPSKKQSLIATWEKWAKANRVKPFHK